MAKQKRYNGYLRKTFTLYGKRIYVYGKTAKELADNEAIKRAELLGEKLEQRPQDYKILSEILGHKDISITLNLYTHVMTDKKVEAMRDIMINVS